MPLIVIEVIASKKGLWTFACRVCQTVIMESLNQSLREPHREKERETKEREKQREKNREKLAGTNIFKKSLEVSTGWKSGKDIHNLN